MPRLTQFFATLTRWGLGLCALLVILTALFVSLGRQFVPLVAEYRSDVEARASAALGSPLSIGSLEGRWSGLAPVLLAHDVTLGSGADALHLDSVRVVPDLWDSLLARQVRIDHLQVSGLQLSVEQASDGQWSLKGLPKQDDKPFDPQQALTQLQQVRRLSVLDSQLTLEPSDHPPVTLTYVGLSLATGSSRQRLDLRATLPDGQPLAIDLSAEVRAEQWRDGKAQVYLSLPQSDWAQWLPPQLLRSYKLDHLKAGGEFWLDWGNGHVRRAVARLNAPQVRAAYADRKPYEVNDLGLNAWMQRSAEGFDVQVASLGMNLGKQRWESRLALRQRAATAQAEESWHVQADRLDLTPLTPLIDALVPLPETAAAVVDGLKVTGGLRNVLLDIRPKASGDQRFSFAANLDKVGFNAYHGAPAAGNVTGSISGDLGQGELRLATDDFMLHLDPIFTNAWRYKQANARLTWRLTKDDFTLVAPYIKVLGEEGKVASDFLIRLPLDHVREPYMDLRVGMTEGDGRFTSKYLPAVLSPSVDHWLRTAVIKGDVEQGYFQYQGSLSHAAPEHSRSITLFFRVHDAELAFQPGWPAAKKVDGNVYIQDGDVRIDASKGQILDTQVSDVQVRVPHVPAGKLSHLYVDGKFDGSLGDGLKILQQAPIGTGPIFEGWQGTGPLQGKLNLDIPLEKGHEPKVVVDFDTRDASLKIASPQLDLSKLKGSFRFDFDKGLSGQGISAQAFDKPVTAQIFAEGKPGEPVTRIQAKGQIGVKRLADWLKVTQALPASGEIPYQLQVTLAGEASRLSVDSDLKGVQIDLPAPLGKASADSRPTQFGMNLQGAQRQLDVSYAGLASFTYAAPANNLGEGRGELFVGEGGAQLPAGKGLRVRGVMDELDLDPWKQKVESYAGDDPGDNARQVLNEIDLKVRRLKGFGQSLDDVTVALKRSASAWNLDIASQQVTGSVGLPDAKGAPIAVNLQTVRLPAPDPATVSPQATVDPPDPLADVDPRKIPAVDIKVQRLMQGDELIGAWALKLRPTAKGLAMNDLDLGLKGMQLQGAGGWEGAPGASGSWFKGRIEGKNLADVLKAWKFAPTVTSESFHLDADGRWPGSPAWIGLKRYSGSLDATLRTGQFVEIEGGAQALRVFGLLNFNSIGRRLRLDFSDLLGKGLSYDKVKGLLVASDGVYVTRTPITMEGPSTNLELDGTLDMVNDRVDAALQVALPVTNSLPIAALLVGAPAVGGALFLVDKLFGDRVARFASVNYRIEGPWKEPKITLSKPFDKKR